MRLSTLFNLLGRIATTMLIFDIRYKKTLKYVSKHSKGNVLDIGCGTKPYKRIFSHKTYTGIEVPWSEIRTDADVFADGTLLPFKPGVFDTVLLFEVLEHAKDPYKVMKEANRVLNKDGYLILSTPQMFMTHGAPHDYQRFTYFGLKNILEENGFEIKEHHKICGAWGSAGIFLILFFTNFYGLENRKTKLRHALKIFIWPLCFVTQTFFALMDKLHGHAGDPANNIVVAIKKG